MITFKVTHANPVFQAPNFNEFTKNPEVEVLEETPQQLIAKVDELAWESILYFNACGHQFFKISQIEGD